MKPNELLVAFGYEDLETEKPCVLIKMSAPGFIKDFDTEVELREELEKWICSDCVEECGSDLLGLMSSDCGCEFETVGTSIDREWKRVK
jgi:hypothetical protein